MKDQIFKTLPTEEIISEVLKCFGLENINDKKYFSRNDLKKIKTIQNINNIKLDLDKFYLPCKSKIYLNDLTEKKTITILRHFIKYSQYKLISQEKYMNKTKIIIYQLIKKDTFDCKPLILEDNKTIFF
tara:strand:- start:232 stop:618 length:387 start_codon:yes stop_codon:yes gene_type:complete